MPPPAAGLTSRFIVGPTLRTQPDRRLVSLVRDGYEVAFDEIVRRYAKPLGRYAASIVGGRSEDVTQDAFSKALVALRRDGAEIELRPWLYRIVRNTALNDLRDRPPTPEALAEAIAGGRSAAEEVERREEITDLVTRLRALPEPQRAAIVMRELEGLSHDEIAAALGLSGGAARQVIYRARRALRDGAALLVPIPLLRFLLDHGTEVAAGASAGGAAVAAGATAGGAGAGGALKLGALAAVLASSVGTGIALQEHRGGGDAANAGGSVTQSAPETGGPSALSSEPSGGDNLPTPVEDRRDADGQQGGKSGSGQDGGEDGLRLEDARHEGERGDEEPPPRGLGPDPEGPHHGRRGGEGRGAAHGQGPRGAGHEPGQPGGPGKSGPGPQGPEGGQHRGAGGGERSGHGPGGRSGQGGGPGPEGEPEPDQPPPPPPEDPNAPDGGPGPGGRGSGEQDDGSP